MHLTAVVLIAFAGLCYCLVAGRRWLRLRLVQDVAGRSWLVWIGMVLHSAGLALSLIDAEHPDFAHAVLGSWAALASLLFLSRFLASPNRWLLVLPVGGINEKIEGWFRVCEAAGLDGRQGVLIPARNRRHLMLAPRLVEAVAAGRFQLHAADHVSEGLALLAGVAAGEPDAAGHYPHASVLGHAQDTLLA